MISENNKIKTKKNTWKKTPTVFQMEVTECGAACLGSILGYYKKYVGLEELRVSCGVSKDGCSADNIVKAAQNYGLDYKAYSYSIEELLEQDEPCIIHWDFKHYVVYEGIKHNKIYINDPDGGRRVVPYDELYGSFTGVALCFKPNENFKTVSRPSSIFDFLIKRSRTHISTLFLLFLFGLVLVVPPVLTSAYTRVFIDWIIYTKNIEWFIMLVFMMLFTILYQIIFSIFRIAIVQKFQLRLSFLSGYEFLDRMLKMPLMFYSQRYAGDLSNRVSLNDEANTFISGNIVNIVLDIFTSIFYLILMFVYNVPLTLISIVCVSVLIYVSARIFLLSNEIAIKYSQDFSKLSGIMIQGAEIFATIKATGSEKNFVKKLIGLYSGMGKNDQQLYRLNAYLGFLPTVIVNIFNIVLLCIGALFATKGVISVGVLAAFMIIFASFVLPVTNMFVIFQQFQKLRANLMRITDIENYQTDPIFKQEKISKNKLDEKLTGPVELKNVSFGYNKTKDPIIKDFSVKVMPGETIALVGPSGSCKSTVLKLISGLYEPWSGEILINNKPIYEYSQGALASSMSSVDQEIVMFSGSVRENITLWNDFVYEDDIFNAAKDACIHDIISGLPGGYNYQLEHGAKNISTGQRQRLEIARALVCNPGILLMDEATSALDPIVEKKIIDNIRRRGCLCVVVAHRLSTIRDADKIICIDNGQIVQVGTHDELKQDEGLYKDLIKNL